MDYRQPTEREAADLEELHAKQHRFWGLVALMPITSLVIFALVLVRPPVPVVVGSMIIVGLVFITFVYKLLGMHLFTKCPRCGSRPTVLKGNCTQCGLHLDARRVETRNSPVT